MRILLLRHGQTPSNVHGLLDTGAPGPHLTQLGERQAASVPKVLAERRIDAVAVSPLTRTSLTAEPLVHRRGLTTTVYDGLREVEAGHLEMSGALADQAKYLETIFAWARGDLDQRMPGGPDGTAFYERFDHAITSLASGGQESLVVVSHGAAIRAWTSARVKGLTADLLQHHTLGNTGAVDIEGDPDAGWRLIGWSQEPIGGRGLSTANADDPTGESVQEASDDAQQRAWRPRER